MSMTKISMPAPRPQVGAASDANWAVASFQVSLPRRVQALGPGHDRLHQGGFREEADRLELVKALLRPDLAKLGTRTMNADALDFFCCIPKPDIYIRAVGKWRS